MRGALSQQLQRTLSQLHHLALAILLVIIVVGLNRLVGNCFDHLNDFFRLADKVDQLLILRLEKLEQCPDGDVLESCISTCEEAF